MKSIKTKILLCMVLTVLFSLSLVGGISIYLNYSSTVDTMEQTMTEMAETASERVTMELDIYKNIAYEVGSIARLANSDSTVAEKKAIIDQRANTHGFERGNIIGTDGLSIFDGKDFNDREYFQRSMKGEMMVSEPLISKITGELTIIISAPLWENGIPDTKVIGVVYFVPKETFLNDIVASMKVSTNGGSYILSKNGVTIAHENMDNVMNQENTQEDAKSDKALLKLASLEKQMTEGKNGFGRYEYGGVRKFLAYAPIEGTDGWSIGINAPTSDFLASTQTGIIITVVILIASLIVSVVIAFILAAGIGDPMIACAKRMQTLVRGDLNSPVPAVKSHDETAVLSAASKELVDGLNVIIRDVGYLLNELAGGNLTVETEHETAYVGDFNGILIAIQSLKKELREAMGKINQSSDQVASGAEQVSAGAQALSQGATEQASSVQELAATITEISNHVKKNAHSAEEASSQAEETTRELENGKEQMRQMTLAMNEINDTSSEIGKIIKTIEDIAFQTNILALNAAVEAARAGEAGKGFAVVADEVRNLASKSAEASKNTAVLIESSTQSVYKGTEIAGETAASLNRIVESSEKTAGLIYEISNASQEQANSIAQVTLGIDQISSVVQTNSATAEESAATSEELSGQAQVLKGLIGRFKF